MTQRRTMEGQRVLMLALRIAIAWTSLSLLCVGLWALRIELFERFGNAKRREFHPKVRI